MSLYQPSDRHPSIANSLGVGLSPSFQLTIRHQGTESSSLYFHTTFLYVRHYADAGGLASHCRYHMKQPMAPSGAKDDDVSTSSSPHFAPPSTRTELATVVGSEEKNVDGLPDGWSCVMHTNGLPVFYHEPSEVVSWTKPYRLSIERDRMDVGSIPSVLFDHKPPPSIFPKSASRRSSSNLMGHHSMASSVEDLSPEPKRMKTDASEDAYPFSETSSTTSTPFEAELNTVLSVLSNDELTRDKTENLDTKKSKRVRTRKSDRSKDKPFHFTTEGKTPVSALLDYCRGVMKTVPRYVSATRDDAAKPFSTEIFIHDKLYGRGESSTKKQAKQIAATQALTVLVPDFDPKSICLTTTGLLPALHAGETVGRERKYAPHGVPDVRLTFPGEDPVEILRKSRPDPNLLQVDDEIALFCGPPHYKSSNQMLHEYCDLHQCRLDLRYEIISAEEAQKNKSIVGEVTTKCIADLDGHVMEGYGRSKKEAKMRASQLHLKELYPHINSWGRLQDVFSCRQEPNSKFNVKMLDRLKEEMRKVRREREEKDIDRTD
ncbi:microprocessor complex subunit DGCR8-like [Planoprotostelium fungivorum]|uniref:Microprocessor complex subunit DGCR8-like n=1 Tax=Planoprotostelium fungivorum TaxID=1890364 RepID=A0A2P6N5E2_9EUKA|nr:microprocessor complex subunit DGCR8-like [Planoprotostelium fungivorum]